MKVDDIKEVAFWVAVASILVIALACFIPSAGSIYEFAMQLGFSRLWAVCFCAILDGTIIVAHVAAAWLGMSQQSDATRAATRHAIAAVYGVTVLSVALNILHATEELPASITLADIMEIRPTWKQVLGSLPPLLLLATFGLVMRLTDIRINDVVATEAATARRESAQRARDIAKTTAREKRLAAIRQILHLGRPVDKKRLATQFGVHVRQIERDLSDIAAERKTVTAAP